MKRVQLERITVDGVTLVARRLTLTFGGARWAWTWTYSHPGWVQAPGQTHPVRIHDHVLDLKLMAVIVTVAALAIRSRS